MSEKLTFKYQGSGVEGPNTTQLFQTYGKEVVHYSRAILSKRKRNTKAKTLYKEMDYIVNFNQQTGEYTVGFTFGKAEKYVPFVDSGVHGSVKTGSPKWARSEKPVGKNNKMMGWKPRFQFKGKNIKEGIVEKWIKDKPIKLRDAKGRFIKKDSANIKSASFMIGRAIATRGLPFSGFFTTPVIRQNANIEQRLMDNLEQDLTEFMHKQLTKFFE